MRVTGTTLALWMLLGAGFAATGAVAAAPRETHAAAPRETHAAAARPAPLRVSATPQRQARSSPGQGGISCVPYARSVTGMAISGDGGQWWHNAAGLYARGQRPEAGAVMAFRGSGSMSRGHVAVVRRVLGPREVLIDHANWGGPGIRRGSVMRNVAVVDVSDRNDWTAVKVQVGHDASLFGRTYATFGFIHNRPDAGAGTAFAGLPAPDAARFEQVADLPDTRLPVVLRPEAPQAPARRR